MAIQVTLEDHNGNMLHQAKLSESASVSQLMPALITALRLPITDEAGRPINYHLSYNSRRLNRDETLTDAQVQEGETIVVIPEMTAGGQTEPQENWEPLVVLESTTLRYQPIAGFPNGYYADKQQRSVHVWLPPLVLNKVEKQSRKHERHEIGGILQGKVYEENGRFLVQVEKALEAQHTVAGMTFVTFTEQTWQDLLRQRADSSLPVVGWYHSHPGLGIFLSRSDEFIHYNYFGNQPWYIALVVDPISTDWGVFVWENGAIQRCAA